MSREGQPITNIVCEPKYGWVAGRSVPVLPRRAAGTLLFFRFESGNEVCAASKNVETKESERGEWARYPDCRCSCCLPRLHQQLAHITSPSYFWSSEESIFCATDRVRLDFEWCICASSCKQLVEVHALVSPRSLYPFALCPLCSLCSPLIITAVNIVHIIRMLFPVAYSGPSRLVISADC